MPYIKNIIIGLILLISALLAPKDQPQPSQPPPVSPAPDFRHALDLYESDRYEEAAAECELLASGPDEGPWKARAYFLAGRAYSSAGLMPQAEGSFGEALKVLPELAPYAHFKLARGYESAGEDEKAVEMFMKVAGKDGKSGLAEEALMGAGRLENGLGNHEEAVKVLSGLLERRPARELRARAYYYLMSSYASLGDNGKAYTQYMKLWKSHPAAPEMEDAKALLVKMEREGFKHASPGTGDRIEHATSLSESGNYLSAAVELRKVLSVLKASDPRVPEVTFDTGMMYYRARNNSKAAGMFMKVAGTYPGAPEAPSALYWLARVRLRTDDEPGLRRALARLEEKYPNHPNTAYVTLLLGSELMAEEKYGDAVEVLTGLAKRYPSSSVLDDAMWKLAWSYYLSGMYDKAAAAFGELSERFKGGIYEAGGKYWHARSIMAAGDDKRGREILGQLEKDYGLSFYGHIAGVPGGKLVMDEKRRPPAGAPRPAAAEKYEDPELALSYELGIQNMRADAMAVLRNAERRYGLTVEGIRTLAGLYAMVDDYRRPLELASELYEPGMDSGRSSIPDEAMTLIFPPGFWEVIWNEARKYDVDPLLVASLIREESHFDPTAVSPAGAVGLMQMMPSTAAEVCRKLDMSPPTHADLKDGSYNVPLGVCHLSYLIQKHEGRLVYVLAEYNAGPSALKRWRERMPEDVPDDEFAERIGYRETRNYVKRVLRNYYVYQELYGG